MIRETNMLVCSDFSEASDRTLKVAVQLAEKAHGRLHVLHVNEFPAFWEPAINYYRPNFIEEKFELELIDQSRRRLEAQMSHHQVKGEAHVRLGVTFQAIHEFIDEKKVNLLILGHKGHGGSPFSVGGLAAKMIASSPVPVLIVKKDHWKTKIGGCVDPNGPMKEIIEASRELAEVLHLPLELVALFPDIGARYAGLKRIGISNKLLTLDEKDREAVVRSMRESIRDELGAETKATIRAEVSVEKKLAYHLNSILSEDHVGLAVLKRHQAGLLEKLLIGSETMRMLEVFDGNLLILPP